MDWDISCPAPELIHKKAFNLASTLILAILGKENVDGLFFSNMSVGSSPAWYFHLSPFETLFCGMLILQIFALRYLEILPINLNNWLVGDPAGRKRRSVNKKLHRQEPNDHLTEATLSLLRRLDDQDCLLKSLCILQAQSLRGSSMPNLPKETKAMVAALATSGKWRRKMESQSSADNDIDHKSVSGKKAKAPAIKIFEDAVLTGSTISVVKSSSNVTLDICGPNYRACSVSSDDIIRYIDIIADAGML